MNELLTVKEISDFYDLCINCITTHIKKNELQSKGIRNSAYLYDRNEIEKIMKGVHCRKKRSSQKKRQSKKELWKVSVWTESFWKVQHCSMEKEVAEKMAKEYEKSGLITKISRNINQGEM